MRQIVLVGLLLAVAASPAAALADTPAPLAWSGGAVIDPVPYPQAGATAFVPTTLNSPSCPSEALCVAVDNAGNIVTSTDPSQAWNVAKVDVGHAITGVSCPSVELCVAADDAGNILTSTDPVGGTTAWTVTNVTSSAFGLRGISCASASLCVAIGDGGRVVTSADPTGGPSMWSTGVLNSNDVFFGVACPSNSLCLVTALSGGIYSATDPTGGASKWAAVATPSPIVAISCPSGAFCVGVVRPTPGSGQPQNDLITSTDPADGATATWTGEHVDGSNSMNAITCLSNSSCVAVDANGNVLESSNPAGGASAWTISKVLQGPSAYGAGAFSGVSCVTGPTCLAVYGTQIWATFDPTSGSSGWFEANRDVPLYGASCATASFCAAVDDLGNVLTTTSPATGGRWSATHLTGVTLLSVSCPEVGFCAASDIAGDVLVSTDPAGGASWNTLHVDGAEAITSVSCPTTTFCAAVDDSGNVLTSTNPAGGTGAWSSTNIDGGELLNGISCTSSDFCAAVDDAGNVLVSTDPTGADAWHTKAVDSANSLLAISCVSEVLCVAVDDAGNVITSTSPASSTHAWTSARIDNAALYAISCPSSTMCVAVDSAGFELNTINPAGGANEWTDTDVGGDNSNSLNAVSCPDTSACSVLVGNGQAFWGGATPSNLTLPSITGQAMQANPLTELHGTWTPSPTTYAMQWERCNASGATCSNIPGATGPSYTLGAADVGSTIRVLELASNANGDGVTVESGQTAVVLAAPHSTPMQPAVAPTAPPAGSGVGTATIRHATTSATTANVLVSCAGSPGATCSLVLRMTVQETIKAGKVIAVTAETKPKKKVVLLGTTTIAVTAGQSKIVKVSLNSAGKRLLSQRHRLNAKLVVAQAGKTVSSTIITFKTKPKKKR